MVAVLFVLAFAPMVLETWRSASNARRLIAAGAIEPPNDVFDKMRLLYPGCFMAMCAEAWLRGAQPGALAAAGTVVFVLAKGLKYWAIGTLGVRWTFKVLVPPGSSRIVAGPYRIMRHPNYVSVAGELVGFALMAGAVVSGPLAVAVFLALMLARIAVEERALGNQGSVAPTKGQV